MSRRTVIKAGGAAGLGTALATSAVTPAQGEPITFDLGLAVVQFSLKMAKRVGDTLFIGSRNLEPARIVALDRLSGKVVAQTTLSNGDTVQDTGVSADGSLLYAGINQKKKGPSPTCLAGIFPT